jgi:predicted phosphoribosyltransferase
MRFRDRLDAGHAVARLLSAYAGRTGVIVLGLPRGGVPVAAEIARELGAPFDVFLVRKLGVPGHEELGFGAIAEGGVRVLNEPLVADLDLPVRVIEHVATLEGLELARRQQLYRNGRSAPGLRDRIVILVDDGLATGATMEAAIAAARQQGPARVVVAAPVGAQETCDRLRRLADDLVCAAMPEPFQAVGLWYEDFHQTTDEEVRALLYERRSADG